MKKIDCYLFVLKCAVFFLTWLLCVLCNLLAIQCFWGVAATSVANRMSIDDKELVMSSNERGLSM